MILNDFELPKYGVLVIFLQFLAATHTSTVNCNEIDGDRPGQPGNWNCYRLSRVAWALLKLLVFFLTLTDFPLIVW